MPLEDNALTTINKIDLQISDAEKERLINAASDMIESYTDRDFRKQTYSNEKYQPTGRQRLILDKIPVISISEITQEGETIDSTEYFIEDSEAGLIFKHDRWQEDYKLARRSIGKDFEPGTNRYNLEVTYTAGYVLPKDDNDPDPRTLPYDLEQAAILTVQYLNNTESSNLRVERESISDLSQSYFQQEMNDQLPAEILNKIDRYRDYSWE